MSLAVLSACTGRPLFEMQGACRYMSRKYGCGEIQAQHLRRILRASLGVWLGFLAIGLVVRGIYSGKFSPTEAAGVTAGFCLILGVITYRFAKRPGINPDGSVEGLSAGASLLVHEGACVNQEQ